MENKELTLTHVSVVFAELNENSDFGRSITIDATEPDVQAFITKWAESNNYNVRIKDYERDGVKTKQVTFKLSQYTKIAGKEGLSEKDLTRGAKVNLIVRTYEYTLPTGVKGISASISNLFIVEGGKSKMSRIAE